MKIKKILKWLAIGVGIVILLIITFLITILGAMPTSVSTDAQIRAAVNREL